MKSGIWNRASWGVTAGETSGVNDYVRVSGASRRNGCCRSTYGVVLAQVPLVIERLLVHLLHVAVGVAAVHFDTVWRGRDTMMGAEDVVERLGEDGRAGLAEVRHAIVEEVGIHVRLGQAVGLGLLRAGCAISVILGDWRGELVVEVVVVVEGVGRAAVLWATVTEGDVVEVGQVEVVEVVEVDKVSKVLIARSVHAGPRLRISTVHCVRRAPAGEVQQVGKWEESRFTKREQFLRRRWWG